MRNSYFTRGRGLGLYVELRRRHICNWQGCTRVYFNHSARPMLACPLCQFLPKFKAWALERKRAQRRASYLRCAGRV